MSSKVDDTKEKLAWSSLWGIGRGITVHSLIYPLEVIKIRQQCSQDESKSIRIALKMLQQEGIGAFYKGLAPQLLKTSIKQVWCWPMITGMPSVLQRYQIENLCQQALTGLSIATIDAALSTPLERAKIVAAFRGTRKLQIRLHVYADQSCKGKAHNLADISEAHNHRWNFSTRILSGGYLHTIYRMDFTDTGKSYLAPIMIRHEGVGSCYALHHSQYHSIIEEPNTVSLIVRGSIEKQSFQVMAEKEGEIQAKDSLTLQTPEEKRQKTMTLADYEKMLNHLLILKII